MSERPRRHLGLLLVVLIVAALAVPKLLSWARSDDPPAAAGAGSGPASPTPVLDAVRVRPQRLTERLATTGTLRPDEQVNVVGEIAGKVAAIHFAEGSRVAAGELLVKIDDSELQAQRESALTRVALAERREARERTLLDEGILSQQEYDLRRGELDVLTAELRLIEARLEKTEIRAPFAGVIGLRAVSEGGYLSPQTRIATLQAVDPVKLDFALPEQYAGQVRLGDTIEFRVKGDEQLYRGEIYAVEPSVDPETRSLSLRAASPNPHGRLTPGSFADVELTVRAVDDALAVPAIAVVPELGGKRVFVYEDGKAAVRQVETGLRTESLVEVTRGLEDGDLVLVSGIQQLRDGLPVEVRERPPAGVDTGPEDTAP